MAIHATLKHVAIEHKSDKDPEEKIEMIVPHVSSILRIFGLDLQGEGLRDTPRRVARMLVRETFRGLDPARKPVLTLFRKSGRYREMVMVREITFFSSCEHHLLPFFGTAHVAYFPKHFIVGLSKMNRLVQYLASKPQTQERLTEEIGTELADALQTNDVAVIMEGTHMCIAARGIKDVKSVTRTSFFSGLFEEDRARSEFLRELRSENHS